MNRPFDFVVVLVAKTVADEVTRRSFFPTAIRLLTSAATIFELTRAGGTVRLPRLGSVSPASQNFS